MFEKTVSIGDIITINDVEVKVIGVYEEVGSPTDDAQIYMSKEGFIEIFDIDDYEYIYMSAVSDQTPTEVAERIKEKFRKHRDLKEGEEDFQVQTFEDVMATFTNVIVILNAILVIIAFISVIVAAVNIVNTMYTSVLERTQEIGVMKSIGARNQFITMMFMMEAGILGLVGGAIGIGFGYLISSFGGVIAAQAGLSLLRPAFPIWLIMGCLVFAFMVGALSGLFPALQASKLNPIDALHYE
jgi:putative ABC transport system permease protein